MDPIDHNPEESAVRRDGAIDFSGYCASQLTDIVEIIDRDRFPNHFAKLMAELARRTAATDSAIRDTSSFSGRFSRRDGIRGWLESRVNHSPLYGAGSIDLESSHVVLNGGRRTWLGAPIQTQLARSTADIRNVTVTGDVVGFDVPRRYLRPWRIAFKAASPVLASALAKRLPDVSTEGFERRWRAARDFNSRLSGIARPPAVTAILIAANVLTFLVMCALTKRFGQFNVVQLVTFGSNVGPLTVNGQWWRLFTAIFLHMNALHLALNMWTLWNVGRLCEQLFGRFKFTFLYFASGILASVSSIVWNPDVRTIGASGAIFGVLGAFLAFFVNPRNHVPASIARRHWIGTTIFMLFNLVSGALQPNIDNAAHVGGLVAGVALGLILARPLQSEVRRAFDAPRATLATMLLVSLMAGAVWQVKGVGSELTAPERFFQTHQTLARDEADNLQRWTVLSAQASAGLISTQEMHDRFEQDIVPFWRTSQTQLEAESRAPTGAASPYLGLVVDFVKARADWAQGIVASSTDDGSDHTSELTKLASKANTAQARLERVEIRAAVDHRRRALTKIPIMAAARRLIMGSYWSCIAPKAHVTVPAAATADSDGPALFAKAGCHAQELFMRDDYRGLDSLLKRYSTTLGDLPDGSSTYEGMIVGLSNLFAGRADPTSMLGRTSDWRRSVENSRTPDILEAMIFRSSAWTFRGSGAAASVSAQQWVQFTYRIDMAAAALEDTAADAAANPVWYAASLEVGLDHKDQTEELRATFDEGHAKFPDYHSLEYRMMRALMPRWGGSYQDVDRFIQAVYERTSAQRGFEDYARLYSEYAEMEGDELDLFGDTEAFWSGMRSGYLGLVKRYPDSDVVLNRFANMACRAGDADQFASLRGSIGKRYSAVAWSTTWSLESCDKKFADATAHRGLNTPSDTTASSTASVRTLGGIKLEGSSADVLSAKGAPSETPSGRWTYAIGQAPHAGQIVAVFSPADGDPADAKVVRIEFTGDETSAPRELDFLNGLEVSDLKERFGYLTGMGSPSQDVTRYEFKNGVFADVRNDKVFRYGIQTAPPAPPLKHRP